MGFAINIGGLPVNIMRAPEAEINHARGHCVVRHFINQHKTAQRFAVGIGLEGNGLVG